MLDDKSSTARCDLAYSTAPTAHRSHGTFTPRITFTIVL
jgi:hypothetical protein